MAVALVPCASIEDSFFGASSLILLACMSAWVSTLKNVISLSLSIPVRSVGPSSPFAAKFALMSASPISRVFISISLSATLEKGEFPTSDMFVFTAAPKTPATITKAVSRVKSSLPTFSLRIFASPSIVFQWFFPGIEDRNRKKRIRHPKRTKVGSMALAHKISKCYLCLPSIFKLLSLTGKRNFHGYAYTKKTVSTHLSLRPSRALVFQSPFLGTILYIITKVYKMFGYLKLA